MDSMKKEEKIEKKNFFLKNTFFVFVFTCTILLFTMTELYVDVQSKKIWMYVGTLLLWTIAVTWYRFFCKKQLRTIRGERFRFLATGKKTAGLLLFLCLVTTMAASFVTESEAMKLQNGKEKKIEKVIVDEYGRKLIIRRNSEKETESMGAGLH